MLGGRSGEALDLELRERRVAVGRGEVAHQTDDLPARRRQLGDPPTAHPRVQLEVDAHTLGHLTVGDHQLEPRVARVGDLAARGRAHDEDAHRPQLPPQRQALRHRRDAERTRPGSERHTADVKRRRARSRPP